jgi:hypothetical protein
VRYLASLCVLAALGLAACGGDDETTTTTTAGATGATGATGGEGAAVDLDRFRELITEQVVDAQGLSQKQAECAVDRIFDEVSEEDLQQAAQTGQPPEELLDAAFDAGVACAGK